MHWPPLHIAAEKARNKTRKQADYRTTLFSSRYTCRLPAREHASACASRHRPTKKEHREPARGGREFRSVGSIKEQGMNCSIDISEGPHAWYNKAWARSNRAGQVRGQALSVNQGKWFVKGRARACEIGHACATQRGVFLRLRLRRVCTCLL